MSIIKIILKKRALDVVSGKTTFILNFGEKAHKIKLKSVSVIQVKLQTKREK